MRIGIKALITIFPIFALISYFLEHWLEVEAVYWVLVYLGAVSGVYIVYELADYFCCEKTNPDWVFKVSREDLQNIKEAVVKKREEFT